MDPGLHQVAERGVDGALALDAIEANEGRAFDGQREMAFAMAVMTGVADVMVALVVELEPGRGEGGDEAVPDLGGDGGVARFGRGGDAVHLFYIGR